MKTIFKYKIGLLLFLSLVITSCSETYNLQSNNYEQALVIEATITNEFKKQEIKITKTSKFENTDTEVEAGATVTVFDNKGNNYRFKEDAGLYVSETEFKAEPNTEYGLNILTSDGKIYQSSNEKLTTESSIISVTPEVVTLRNEGRGVQIKVKSYDPTNTSKYYRFKYEESYKIIAPKWADRKAIVTGPQEITLEPNSLDTKICYTVKNSTDIMLMNTLDLTEDRVDYPIRFISDQNFIISYRYSILVTQYVQSLASYNFYRIMKEIAGNSSVLSPKQPGVLNGNIKCISNKDEKIIGFFDVSTVSSQRMFFNYADLFPGEPIPPYFTDCQFSSYNFCFGFNDSNPCRGKELINALENNQLTFFFLNPPDSYLMMPAECGDCTKFSANIKPSFWID